jgi:hypothetical protein
VIKLEGSAKIYLKKNQYVVKLRTPKFKGVMICKNIVELDNALSKITGAFQDITFHIRFSQGALGKYTWEIDSPFLLFKMGFKFMGYIKNSDIRMFYSDELRELITIDENGILTRYYL